MRLLFEEKKTTGDILLIWLGKKTILFVLLRLAPSYPVSSHREQIPFPFMLLAQDDDVEADDMLGPRLRLSSL